MKPKLRFCGRCGKNITNQEEQIRIGSTDKNQIAVCLECEDVWRDRYIKMLDNLRLSGEEWHEKWEELYVKFVTEGKKREVVKFT